MSLSSKKSFGSACAPTGRPNIFLQLSAYELKHLVSHLLELGDWRGIAVVLEIDYLEIKAERGWIFELIDEVAAVVRSQPEADVRLEAIFGALQRNSGYIARRPMTLFQCVWNTCCWKDPNLLGPFLQDLADTGGTDHRLSPITDLLTRWCWWRAERPPGSGSARLSPITDLLTHWRKRRAERSPGSVWIRSLRPTLSDLDPNVQLVLPIANYVGQPEIVRFTQDSAVVVIWFCKYEKGRIISGAPLAWDCHSGQAVSVPPDMPKAPPEPGRSPNRELIATYGGPDGGWNFPVCIAGFGAPSDVREYHTEPDTHISAVAISRSARLLAGTGYGLEGGDAYVWDVASRNVVARPNADKQSYAVSFSEDESQLAFASGSELKVRDLVSGDERTIGTQDGWIRAIAFSPDGCRIASISHDGTCRIYLLRGSRSGSKPWGPSTYIAELIFSPTGHRLVSRADNGTLHLWDGETGLPITCLASSDMIVLEGGDAHRCLFITDEKLRSTAELAGLWDVRTGRRIERGKQSRSHLGDAVEVSPDGSRLCNYRGSELQLCDPQKGQQLASFTQNAMIQCVAFTPNSRHFAYGAGDGRLQIRTATSGELRCDFQAHEAAIVDCAVSRNGMRLATLGADQQLLVWRWTELLGVGLSTPKPLYRVHPEAQLNVSRILPADRVGDHEGGNLRLAFSALDDRHVIVQAGRSFDILDWQRGAHVRAVTTTDLLDEVVSSRQTHLRVTGDEVVISDALSGVPKAWLPVPVGLTSLTFVRSSAGSVWAGKISHTILHFRLETD